MSCLERDVDLRTLRAATGASSVPQAFVNGERIGGSEDLAEWLAEPERRVA